MLDQRSTIMLGVGVVVIAATGLLPIDASVVRQHTVDRLARDGIKALHPKGAPAEIPVVLEIAGDDRDRLRARAAEPMLKDAKGERRPAWKAVEAPPETGHAWLDGMVRIPTLKLATKVEGQNLHFEGRIGENTKTGKARLGDSWALLPPLVALLLAIAVRRVVLALFLAVMSGALVMHGFDPFLAAWVEIRSLLGVGFRWFGSQSIPVDGYFGRVLSDSFNLKILSFTFALVGLVAVVGRMGGTRGLVNAMSPFAKGPRSAQAVTGVMGTAVFFDDYANTVVVGTTARSLTDRMRLSREKLAYIVDSTSAPVAGIAVISTWIGYEVGLFDDLIGTLNAVPNMPRSGYEMFFEVLPMRFYCIFALLLVFLGAWTSRDIGPMYHAERRAREGGGVIPEGAASEAETQAIEKEGVDPRARNALIPIGLVLALILGLILDVGTRGMAEFHPLSLDSWKVVMDKAADDVPLILLVSSLVGGAVAIWMAVAQRLLTFREAVTAYFDGIRTLADAAAILILAWSIKSVCDDLGTGMAIVALVGDSLPPVLLPLIVFLLAGVVAFSTGTSWGTMALVLPVAAPLAATLSGEPIIVLACLGAVLDGAIWGDHCSPISDTTVLSSTACGCPHLAHVRTQLPYAVLAMVAAGLAGYLGYALGLPLLLCYLLGPVILLVGLYGFGKDPNKPATAAPG